MPPRKRAAAQPKDEPTPDAPALDTGEDAEKAAEAGASPQENADDQGTAGGNTPDHTTSTEDTPAPAKSDLQNVDLPCDKCFPNGWPPQAFSVGCDHGTWVRANLD